MTKAHRPQPLIASSLKDAADRCCGAPGVRRYQSEAGASVSWEYLNIGERLAVFLNSDDLYIEILNSRSFRRLKDIRFLGAIDYLIRPTGGKSRTYRHTRQLHTLGVARLAYLFLNNKKLSKDESRLITVAALLHDIGHAPLSHSIEPMFKQSFDIDHHKAGSMIIRGVAPASVGGDEISNILRKFNVDVDKLILLVEGRLFSEDYNSLFSHPVNIDTIEAIIRCKNYISAGYLTHSPEEILFSLNDPRGAGELIDDFWNLKDAVYNVFINGPLGILADKIATDYFRDNERAFVRGDFFRSERSFRRKHPRLFTRLDEERHRLGSSLFVAKTAEQGRRLAQFTKRRFHIESDFPVGHPSRYLQSKIVSSLSFAKLEENAKSEMEQLNILLEFL